MLIKVVLRALTHILPSFMEEGKHSYTGQGKSPATVLLMLPSCSRSAHAGCTGCSEACLETPCNSGCIFVSLPISLCDSCSTSTCKVKSLFFWPTLDLITLAVVTDCSRLLFQSHLFLCGYTQQLWGRQGVLKSQESWKYWHCFLMNKQDTWENIIIFFETFRNLTKHKSKICKSISSWTSTHTAYGSRELLWWIQPREFYCLLLLICNTRKIKGPFSKQILSSQHVRKTGWISSPLVIKFGGIFSARGHNLKFIWSS